MDLPLTRADQLPAIGVGREQLQIDFKGEVDPAQQVELAKDIAAFANCSGGVVLIGAVEEEGKLARYNPLPEARADAIRTAYSRAARDRCSPVPVCEPVAIPFGGGFLIAVSVWPFPAQAIGVRLAGDRVNEGHGGPGWMFPMRVAVDTILVRPEQLPMLMLPELRRTAVLLEAIPAERRRDLSVAVRKGRFPNGRYETAVQLLDFVEVRMLENVAVFRGAAGKLPETPCHIPLDGIESVWSTGKGSWQVAVRGFVEIVGTRDLVYVSVE